MFDKEKKSPRKNKHVSFCLLTYHTKKQTSIFWNEEQTEKKRYSIFHLIIKNNALTEIHKPYEKLDNTFVLASPADKAPSDLQPHYYSKRVFNNVYLLALDNTKK